MVRLKSLILFLMAGSGFLLILATHASATEASSGVKQFKLDDYELTYREDTKDYGFFVELNRSGKTLLKMGPEECLMGDPIGVVPDQPAKDCRSLLGYCFTGGAHCCTTAILLTLCGPDSFLTTIGLEHSTEIQWADINEDGVSELGLSDWSFSYYSIDSNDLDSELFLPFAYSPAFRRLGIWEEGKGWRADRAGEFSRFYAELVAESQEELKTMQVNEEEPQAIAAQTLQLVYYALMAGESEEQAKELLEASLPSSWQAHQGKVREDIKKSVASFNPFKPRPLSQ